MASIQRHGKHQWRAFVARTTPEGKVVRKSRIFESKQDAKDWATAEEVEIKAGAAKAFADKSFGDLLVRYRNDVSTHKRGVRAESLRIGRILQDEIASVPLSALDATHVAAWRDRRLKSVTAASVCREWNTLSHACAIATKEWMWMHGNPFSGVRKPAAAPPRDRLFTKEEIEALCVVSGYTRDYACVTDSARVACAMLFAIETAMRAGEICALQWADIQLERRFLTIKGVGLGAGKTLAAKRDVPLSAEAIRLLGQLPSEDACVFCLKAASLDALFRKAKRRAMIDGLHFHDTRATAITRLARKLDILALARMVGHRDLKMLQVYYRMSAEDIASRL